MEETGFLKRNPIIIAIALCAALMTSSFAQSRSGQRRSDNRVNQEVVDQVRSLISAYFESNNRNGNGRNNNEADPEEDDDGNNGHGNNSSGNDSSNPGGAQGKHNGGGNGNGRNNSSRNDSSNPGGSKRNNHGRGNQKSGNTSTVGSGSVLDLLGIDEEETEPSNTDDPETSEPPPIITPATVTNDPFSNGSSDNEAPTTDPSSKTTLPYGSVPLITEDAVSVDYLFQKLLNNAKQGAEANGDSTKLSAAVIESYETYARKLAKTLSQLSPEQQNFIFYGVTK